MRFAAPRTATAVALVLSLAYPAASVAQVSEADLPECRADAALPCVTGAGAEVETEAELETWVEAFPEEAAAAAERAAEEDGNGAAAAVEEQGGEAPATDVPDPQAEAPEAVPEPRPDVTEAAPEAAPVAEAPAEEPAAEAAPEPAAVTQAEAPEPAPAEEPAVEATPEATDAAPENEAAAPATVEDAIPEVSSDVPPEAPAEGTAQGMAQTDSAGAPAAAAATAAADSTAEVEETVVTEETARSSAEDFTTAIDQQAADSTSSDGSTDRTETLQRALVAGLAGAALVALLDQGGQVTADSGDRLVLRQDDGNLRLFRDENALLRQPGARVRTETFDDGSTRTRVLRDDGTEIVTIRAADGTILRRTRILPDGREVLLIDDMAQSRPVEISDLPDPESEVVRYTGDEAELRLALARAMSQDVGRSFSLRQIREIDRVRYLAPEIEIDAITFATGSAAIQPDQARQLAVLGRTLVSLIEDNPAEIFLIEGHTDAVGDASYNLALSDRRAESVALALTEYFDVPPENLVVQGYGEFDLKVPTLTAERENRRANVRRITGLLGMESASLR